MVFVHILAFNVLQLYISFFTTYRYFSLALAINLYIVIFWNEQILKVNQSCFNYRRKVLIRLINTVNHNSVCSFWGPRIVISD
jgi:hypothetical protein